MRFKFKILLTDGDSKLMGMFGDCIKVRLKINVSENIYDSFVIFLAKELGAPKDSLKLISYDYKKNFIEVDLPDQSYEILMSWIE